MEISEKDPLLTGEFRMSQELQKEHFAMSTTYVGKLDNGTGTIDAFMPENPEIEGKKLGEYLVEVDKNAIGSCIDGREAVGTLHGGSETVGFRPSVAGGSGMTALTGMELLGLSNRNESMRENFGELVETMETAGIRVGGHCDDSALGKGFAEGKTGCGAADRLSEIIANVSDRKMNETEDEAQSRLSFIKNGLQTLLGDEYSEEVFNKTVHNASELRDSERMAEWHGKDMIDTLRSRGDDRISVLKDDHEGVHGHREWAVIVNTVKGTTIDQSKYSKETGLQVFVVDAWRINKVATSLATGPNAEQQAKELYQAMVTYQLATYYTLCNGSQSLVVIA